MVTTGKGSATITPSGHVPEASHRVIGRDGIEREIVTTADWIAAVQSNTVDEECLFFDPEAKRWRPVTDLSMYNSAAAAVASGLTAGGPRDFSAVTKNSVSETEVPPQSELRPSVVAIGGVPRRSAAVWWFLIVVGLLALLIWTATPALWSDFQSGLRRVPLIALLAGAVLVILLAEEVHWFALRLVGLTGTRPGRRFGVQILSLLTAALVSYFAFGPFAVSAPEVALVSFVRNAPAIGAIYAVVLFLWSLPLIALPIAARGKKALASLLAAAMLVGTLYMALAPSARQVGQAGSNRTPSEQRP
jgi:hypothetical protein